MIKTINDEFAATAEEVIEPVVFIEAEPANGGVSITFEHSSAATTLNFVWNERSNFNADNTDLSGEYDGSKWTELLTTGDREAAGLIKALVELGDRLRPLHEKLVGPRRSNLAAPSHPNTLAGDVLEAGAE